MVGFEVLFFIELVSLRSADNGCKKYNIWYDAGDMTTTYRRCQ
jgi:hypothetical protein